MGITQFLNPPINSAALTFQNKVYDGGIASDNSVTILAQNNTAGLAAMSSRKAMLVYNNQTNEVMIDKGSGFVNLSAGGGGSVTNPMPNNTALQWVNGSATNVNILNVDGSNNVSLGGNGSNIGNTDIWASSVGIASYVAHHATHTRLLNTTGTAHGMDFFDNANSGRIRLRAPSSVSGTIIFNLPSVDGTTGQVLTTDGAGTLSFASAGSGANTSLSNLANPTAINRDLTFANIGGGNTRTISTIQTSGAIHADSLALTAGTGTGSGNGGNVVLNAGTSVNGNAGNIEMLSGTNGAGFASGNINLSTPSSGVAGQINLVVNAPSNAGGFGRILLRLEPDTNGARGAVVVDASSLQLPQHSADPSNSNTAGSIYFNTTLNVIRCYNGTIWKSVTMT